METAPTSSGAGGSRLADESFKSKGNESDGESMKPRPPGGRRRSFLSNAPPPEPAPEPKKAPEWSVSSAIHKPSLVPKRMSRTNSELLASLNSIAGRGNKDSSIPRQNLFVLGLRLLQNTPFTFWAETDAEFKELAKVFSLQHFESGQPLPESPFYLVASGSVIVHTDMGTHVPVVHRCGDFFTSCTARKDIENRPISVVKGLRGWLSSLTNMGWEDPSTR